MNRGESKLAFADEVPICRSRMQTCGVWSMGGPETWHCEFPRTQEGASAIIWTDWFLRQNEMTSGLHFQGRLSVLQTFTAKKDCTRVLYRKVR